MTFTQTLNVHSWTELEISRDFHRKEHGGCLAQSWFKLNTLLHKFLNIQCMNKVTILFWIEEALG